MDLLLLQAFEHVNKHLTNHLQNLGRRKGEIRNGGGRKEKEGGREGGTKRGD